MHYLLDDVIVSVSANTSTLDKKNPDGSFINVEDNAQALFKTAKGVQGALQVSWTYYAGEENSTRIYGTKGLIRLYDDPEYSVIVQEKRQHHKDEKSALTQTKIKMRVNAQAQA